MFRFKLVLLRSGALFSSGQLTVLTLYGDTKTIHGHVNTGRQEQPSWCGERKRGGWREGGMGEGRGNHCTEGCGEKGGQGVSPRTSSSASSGSPVRWWPCGPWSPNGSGPTPPGWARVGPTPSSVVHLGAGAHGSLRSAYALLTSCCHLTPLEPTREETEKNTLHNK